MSSKYILSIPFLFLYSRVLYETFNKLKTTNERTTKIQQHPLSSSSPGIVDNGLIWKLPRGLPGCA